MKESGIVWLGRIPQHWELSRIGSCFEERKTTVSDTEYEPLSVTKNGVIPQLDSAAKSDNNEARKLIKAGDFVINSRSDRKGSSGLSSMDGSTSVIYTVLKPRNMYGPYVHHLLRSEPFQEEFYRWGSGIVADLWSTRYAAMKQIPIPLPPFEEQEAIAEFLDRETTQTDALIEKQQLLMQHLGELRKSAITRAVTIGLEPLVELKTTRFHWLTSTPAHWRVLPIKRVASTGAGAGFPLEYQGVNDEEISFLKVNSLSRADNRGLISSSDDTVSRSTAKTLNAKIYPAGSIVLAKIGAALLLGRIRIVGSDSCIDNNMMAIIPSSEVEPRFLYYALNLVDFEYIVNPGTVPSTSEGAVGNFHLSFPPLIEQKQIAQYLDEKTNNIDILLQKAAEMVEVLTERRQALISAAVTGKIDVRGN